MAHDMDPELSYRAILALGLVGFGTNNSRFAFSFVIILN